MTGAAVLVLLLGGGGACLLGLCRGAPVSRLAALVTLSSVLAGVVALLATFYGRSSYLDVALLMVLLSFSGTLVYARFFGRSL
ncbi:MAG TPA: monovalent cation/H+ antiporter complex subunit F [Marmoricola sp.]|nr:monovalent cation/H+ antiporter complex subunit F [Marmoricola sp.]